MKLIEQPLYITKSDTTTAYLIANFVNRSPNSSLIVLVRDNEACLNLSNELSSFLEEPKRLFSLLDPFYGFYSKVNPPQSDLNTLLCKLSAYVTNQKPDVCLVAPIKLIFRLFPNKTFLTNCLKLKSKQEFSSEKLSEFLSDFGYIHSDTLDIPGSFIRRGGVFDIYCPYYSNPVRLDFFGDELDLIYYINSETGLRSSGELQEITIYPVSFVNHSAKALQIAAQTFKSLFETSGHYKAYTESLLSGIISPAYFNYLDLFHPASSQQGLVPFFSLLPERTQIVLTQTPDIEEIIENADIEAAQQKDGLLASDDPCSPFENLFQTKQTVQTWILKNSALGISSVNPGNRLIRDSNLESLPEFLPSDKKEGIGKYAILRKLMKNFIGAKHYRMVISWNSDNFKKKCIYVASREQLSKVGAKKFKLPLLYDVTFIKNAFESGFIDHLHQVVFVSENDIEPYEKEEKTVKKSGRNRYLEQLREFEFDDYVVHKEYGIGIFKGITRQNRGSYNADLLTIEYKNKSRLYLPVYQIDKLERYIGSAKGTRLLDALGSDAFVKRKGRLKKTLEKIAKKLVALYAGRNVANGFRFNVDRELLNAFANDFEFELTKDQRTATEEILSDMASDKPMDRLLCGDVGFGKTEIAMRAAFIAAVNKKQVILIVPTTILAIQHEQTFKKRMSEYGISVASLTRFKTSKQQKQVIKQASAGELDILIGTHRLFQKDVILLNPGLLILDEEQRFGVKQKEKFKAISTGIDILSMSATPIPRTLEMSLSGIKDMSLLFTPPVGRQDVKTYIIRFKKDIIKQGIEREIARGGRIFFIHNRIHNIEKIERFINELVPEVKTAITHGRMNAREVEKKMAGFVTGKIQLLITTAIIESGLDIPGADTIFINEAHRFGLSDLHQLRGRTGRGNRTAHAYFIIPGFSALSKNGKARIEAISKYSSLGSGYQIASHDLEIRGPGNMLGFSQSGQIESVGYNLYMSILEQVLTETKPDKIEQIPDPIIEIPINALIPKEFIAKESDRIALYKQIAALNSFDEITPFRTALEQGKENVPQEIINLLDLQHLKIICRTLFISKLSIKSNLMKINLVEDKTEMWDTFMKFLAEGKIRFLPSGKDEFKKRLPKMKEERLIPFIEKSLKPILNYVKQNSFGVIL